MAVSHLSIAFDPKELDDSKSNKNRNNPGAIVDILNTRPVMNNLSLVRYNSLVGMTILTLQAADISNGRTVSQLTPYCHPHANPHEGSINFTIYMVNAPLTGYITAISASACIIR